MRVPDLQKRHLAALVVASMVLFAGCSGFTSNGSTPSNSTDATTATTTAGTTTSATDTTSTTNASNGGESSDNASSSGNAAKASMQGTMTVLIGGSKVPLSGDSGPVTFRHGDRTWVTSQQGTTVAQALAAEGIELTNSTLTYDGTTYDDATDGTTVEVRVNGQSVDPTQHTLQSSDSVWVYVSTSETNFQPPGKYIQEENDHQHGAISVVVNGDAVNLSKAKYQHQAEHFHLEGGDGETWHAHTWSATYAWAMSTLGMNVTADTVTIAGTTYDDSEDGTTVQVLVNGDPVENPKEYRLKDGDQIRIVVEETN